MTDALLVGLRLVADLDFGSELQRRQRTPAEQDAGCATRQWRLQRGYGAPRARYCAAIYLFYARINDDDEIMNDVDSDA